MILKRFYLNGYNGPFSHLTVLIIDTRRKEDILVISWVTYYCLLVNYEVNNLTFFVESISGRLDFPRAKYVPPAEDNR